MNVKRLIDEMNNGEILGASNGSKLENTGRELPSPIRPTKIAPPVHQNPIDMIKRAMPTIKHSHINPPVKITDSSDTPRSLTPERSVTDIHRGKKPSCAIVAALFSCLMSWGLKPEIDRICQEDLKLMPSRVNIVGCKGASGYFSFPIPTKITTTIDDWNYSSTVSGQRLLVIVALARCLIANYAPSEDAALLAKKFASLIPNEAKCGLPSLSLLIKYWQDSIRKF